MTADPKKSLRQKALTAIKANPEIWTSTECFEAGYRQAIEDASRITDGYRAECELIVGDFDEVDDLEDWETATYVLRLTEAIMSDIRALLPPSERTEEQEGGSDEVETN